MTIFQKNMMKNPHTPNFSGVARAFPGGHAAHPDDQIEERLRKNGEKIMEK